MTAAAPLDPASSAPPALRRAALLAAVEGAAIALAGGAYAVAGLLGDPEDRLATVLAGLFALAAGLGLLLAARGLSVVRGWALSPTVVAQLFLLVVAYGLLQSKVYAVAVPVLLAALAVFSQLFAPQARAAYRGRA